MPFKTTSGGVAVKISLGERDSVIIGLVTDAGEAAEMRLGAAVELKEFDTTLISWGPDPEAAVPTQSKKTALSLGVQPLGNWDQLPATEEQLAFLGVDGMNHVSGQGIYKTTFDLPSCDGALLRVDTGDCMVVGGSINGKPLPALNQRTGETDLSGLVQEGENTLELKIATTLINRLRIAHPLFDGKGGMPENPNAPEGALAGTTPMDELEENDYELPGAPMVMPQPRFGDYHYGILSAVVIPYSK